MKTGFSRGIPKAVSIAIWASILYYISTFMRPLTTQEDAIRRTEWGAESILDSISGYCETIEGLESGRFTLEKLTSDPTLKAALHRVDGHDGWGNPYLISLEANSIHVISYGIDGIKDTVDEIVTIRKCGASVTR